MTELKREVLDQLAEPFAPDVIDFKPGATTNDKKKALALAYVELRAYIDRLNQVVGANWSDQYEFISAPTGELIACGLTICGVTRWDIGEKGSSDVNTATSAMAQSFKRACVKFGLGRHLYAVERVWVPYDEQRKQFTSQAYEQLRRLVSGNAPQPGGNGSSPKVAFFNKVRNDIPFFTDGDHIASALKAAGFTEYDQANDRKMLAALKKHANEAANKEAA
jgi:hypothetical protein